MNRFTLLLSLLIASAINAFQGSMPYRSGLTKAVSTTSRYIILSDQETEKILTTAEECAEGECSVDDVSGLIFELREQQAEMECRLERIMNMVAALQHLNEKDNRDENEVRSFVKDLLRVFAVYEEDKKVPIKPIGFAGDIGKGSTTAYDALPPKKWKPSPNAKP